MTIKAIATVNGDAAEIEMTEDQALQIYWKLQTHFHTEDIAQVLRDCEEDERYTPEMLKALDDNIDRIVEEYEGYLSGSDDWRSHVEDAIESVADDITLESGIKKEPDWEEDYREEW